MTLELSVNKSLILPDLVSRALVRETDDNLVVSSLHLDEDGSLQVQEHSTLDDARRALEFVIESVDEHSPRQQVVVLGRLRGSLRSGAHRAWVLAEWTRSDPFRVTRHPDAPEALWPL